MWSIYRIQSMKYFWFKAEVIMIVFVEMGIEIVSVVLFSWYPDWVNTEIVLLSKIENPDN